jgi:uncharacterized protein
MGRFFTPGRISENIRETPEGYLLCMNVPIARTGNMDYGEGETPLETEDGKVIVTRDAEEVFRPATIASFEGKPITIKHPLNFVNPQNWRDLAKGTLQNVRKGKETDDDGETPLIADLLLTDDFAIQLVRSGLREVSCGYEAEYEQTGPGKGKQVRIIGNHLALVEEGRAGSSYAITDHKGDIDVTFDEIMKQMKLLGKTVDEAAAKAKTKDGNGSPPVASERKEGSVEAKTVDKEMYDELVEAVKDLASKVDGMGKSKDADNMEEDFEDANEENEAEGEILQRVKMLEKAVAKLLGANTTGDEDEEPEEMGDEDEESAAMSEDEGWEEGEEGEKSQKKEKTGDAALVEILAPGMNFKQKNVQAKALKAAWGTKDGKAAILSLTGGKKPTLDSKSEIATLFRGAAHLLKAKRGTGLSGTKDGAGYIEKLLEEQNGNHMKGAITPEKLNELNAAHWAKMSGVKQ